MIFSVKLKPLLTFYVTIIWSTDFDLVFPFLISPRSDLKLIWFFNTFLGFLLPSLKFLNKSLGFW